MTGSQPTVEFQVAYGIIAPLGIFAPVCPLTPLQPTLPPLVISLSAPLPRKYRRGLTKPRDGLPALKRASFRRPRMAATTGAAAEVPPDGVSSPE